MANSHSGLAARCFLSCWSIENYAQLSYWLYYMHGATSVVQRKLQTIFDMVEWSLFFLGMLFVIRARSWWCECAAGPLASHECI